MQPQSSSRTSVLSLRNPQEGRLRLAWRLLGIIGLFFMANIVINGPFLLAGINGPDWLAQMRADLAVVIAVCLAVIWLRFRGKPLNVHLALTEVPVAAVEEV